MSAAAQPRKINLVIVGDGAIGKTSILSTFATNECPDEPGTKLHFFESHPAQMNLDGQIFDFTLSDTGNFLFLFPSLLHGIFLQLAKRNMTISVTS